MRMRSRGLLGVVLVCGLIGLGAPGPSRAQTADPVGLIASAAIVPFWAGGGLFTVFEVTSLNFNADMHAFFFDAACNRVFSAPFRMTKHDADIVFSDTLGLNFNGLMVLARSQDNISPEALQAPITLRGHRVDLVNGSIGVIDPISAAHAEDPTRVWNPLRSGASTVTFPDVTTWWFVCLRNHITVDLGPGIPPVPPGATTIRMRVFDLEEEPLLDIQVPCQCLTSVRPDLLHPIFTREPRYVEMVTTLGLVPIANPPSFVLYRELDFVVGGGGKPVFDPEDFSRQPGMASATLFTGVPQVGAR